MSFDLEIVTAKKLETSQLRSFFSSYKDFQLEGAVGEDVTNVLVVRKTATKTHSSFTVDGPFTVQLDDLEDEVIASTLDPHWLVQISVPAGAAKADLRAAFELSRFIADSCQGSVYDPQQGQVVWPKRKTVRYVAPSKEERIRLVGLEWFLPASQRASSTAISLVQVLRRTCPEALPARFGTFEPLQHRLEPGDDGPFIKIWNEQSEVEYGGSFHWKAKGACFGGSVFFPDWRDKFRPEGVDRAINLSVEFDGRALQSDPRWCETVVNLFGAIARKLRAFYALGYVQRGVIARRRGIWFDGKSEGSPTVPGGWWLGLPPRPTWLAWFGGGYAAELETSLSRFAPIITTEGILLRLGTEPMDRDELKDLFPILPPQLIAREQESPEPAPFGHLLSAKPSAPASSIPRLE